MTINCKTFDLTAYNTHNNEFIYKSTHKFTFNTHFVASTNPINYLNFIVHTS